MHPSPLASRIVRLLFIAAFSPLVGCTKFHMLNATVPSWGYERKSDLAYGNGPRQKLDVYRPRNAKPGASVVIFFYGGDWQFGNKADYRFVAEALTSQGFVAVLPDYRLYPEVKFPGFVEDGAQAIRWAHDHATEFGADPGHIYLMGHSAGAHIAALLTVDERYLKNVGLDRGVVRATASLSGPYDFIPIPGDLAVFGMQSPTDPLDLNSQPVHFIDGHAPPILVVQGMKDTIVDPQKAREFAEKISAAGGVAKFVGYPDRAHADVALSFASGFRWLSPVLRDCSEFFREHQ